MQTEHLAIPSIPVQQWEKECYEAEQALRVGTIFPALNKPFFAAEARPGDPVPDNSQKGLNSSLEDNPLQQERERLMARIYAVSFALDDVVLFVDTHPYQQEAITLRNQLIEERKKLLKDFSEKFYPLTKDCTGFWTEGPMVWEGACV